MGNLALVCHILSRAQVIVELLEPQLRDVVDAQHLEHHFVKAQDGSLEVKGLVDIALGLVDINELPLGQALVDPAVADRLQLNPHPGVRFQPFNEGIVVKAVLDDVETVSLLHICTAVEDLSRISDYLSC